MNDDKWDGYQHHFGEWYRPATKPPLWLTALVTAAAIIVVVSIIKA